MNISSFNPADQKILYTAGVEAAKEYEYEGRVRSSAPRVKLTISAFFLPGVPLEIMGFDMGDLIMNVSYSKDKVNSFGTFNVSLVADESKYEILGRSGLLHTIQKAIGPSAHDILKVRTMAKLDINGYHIMTGFLKSVRKVTTPDSKEYVLQFWELGSVLQEDQLEFRNRQYIPGLQEAMFPISAALSLIPVSTAIYTLLQMYLGATLYAGSSLSPNTTFLLSDGAPIAQRMIAAPAPLGCINNSTWIEHASLSAGMFDNGSNQSLWDYIKHLAVSPFMEMFTESGGRTVVTGRISGSGKEAASVSPDQISDVLSKWTTKATLPSMSIAATLPGFCYIVMRSTPYDNPITGMNPFYPLTYSYDLGVFDLIAGGDFIIITDRDIISKDLGRSDEQQYTMFDVQFTPGGLTSWQPPVVSRGPLGGYMPGGIKSFGPKLYDVDIDFTSLRWRSIADGSAQHLYHWLPINSSGSTLTYPVMSTVAANWFRNASKYMEGTITTRAIPYARPGMMALYLPDKNGKSDDVRELGMYYIDSLSGNYSVGKADTTTFNLIRGTPIPWDASTLAHILMDWEIADPVQIPKTPDKEATPKPL
jgi:hypothetical protein